MAKNNTKNEEKDNEYEEKVLYINRCSKVVKGGRKFSFSALVIVGNGNGLIGVGFAKANEVADAIRKGSEAARKNVKPFILEGTTIPHEVISTWDGAKIMLKPAKEGTGIIAGSKPRSLLEVSGIKDIVAKSLGSNNPQNQVRATFNALLQLRNRKKTVEARGIE